MSRSRTTTRSCFFFFAFKGEPTSTRYSGAHFTAAYSEKFPKEATLLRNKDRDAASDEVRKAAIPDL